MEILSPLHYLNIGPGGKFKGSGKYKSSPVNVDALFEHLAETPPSKLVLHFHGGLVSERKGMKVAAQMAETYGATGHAYSFVWETGFMEVLKERFKEILAKGPFHELKDIVVRKAGQKLGISDADGEAASSREVAAPFGNLESVARSGAAQLDEADLDRMQRDVEAELREELDGRADLMQPFRTGEESLERGLAFSLLDNLARIVIRVIRRYIRKRDHGLLATSVEEILREFYLAEVGVVVWDGIKERARNGMWRPNTDLQNDEQHAGFYFLERLNAFLKKHPGWKVDLVGHSAGSIVICHLLRAIAAQGLSNIRIRQIILMAPACRTRLFHDEIVLHPERYEQVKMFTMTDENECADHLVQFIYPRSLLYLVSGILENGEGISQDETDPEEDDGDYFILGLLRQLDNRKPYQGSEILRKVHEFFSQPDRLISSPAKASGENLGAFCAAVKHGDFDNDRDMLASLAYLIRQ